MRYALYSPRAVQCCRSRAVDLRIISASCTDRYGSYTRLRCVPTTRIAHIIKREMFAAEAFDTRNTHLKLPRSTAGDELSAFDTFERNALVDIDRMQSSVHSIGKDSSHTHRDDCCCSSMQNLQYPTRAALSYRSRAIRMQFL